MKFYGKMQDMECLSGDTLPIFDVKVEIGEGELEGCSMYLILAKSDSPQTAVITKECDITETGFSVRLDSTDTAQLPEGTYDMHFNLVAGDGCCYRKLWGTLYVHTAAQGVT